MTKALQSEILEKLGITALNPMQLAALDAIDSHDEVVLLSPTGSGKTLAFLLPLAGQLKPNVAGVQALILTPTRELALQIESVFRKMGTSWKVNSAYGGHSMRTELNNFSEPPAVLVATPGRLTDHINRGSIDLSGVHMLVLDEFDKCLEMGFHEDLDFIISHLNGLEKKVLISATDLKELPAFTGITKPERLQFLLDAPSKLQLWKVLCPGSEKTDALIDLLCTLSPEPTLIFCNHRELVERISETLNATRIAAITFHGGMEQDERERALIRFRNGSAHYFVTTDLGSRGLDIPEIKHVIHFQLPINEEAFIHRNGRTARQQADGNAYLLLSQNEYLPPYMEDDIPELGLDHQAELPEPPEWITLYFSGGKKDKINKIDLVGFLSKVGELKQNEIGRIDVLDKSSYVAVAIDRAKEILPLIRDEKVKGKKLRIALSR